MSASSGPPIAAEDGSDGRATPLPSPSSALNASPAAPHPHLVHQPSSLVTPPSSTFDESSESSALPDALDEQQLMQAVREAAQGRDILRIKVSPRLLFENRPAVYFCNYKQNKKNNIRMLDTLFTEDFMDSMEEYFHF